MRDGDPPIGNDPSRTRREGNDPTGTRRDAVDATGTRREAGDVSGTRREGGSSNGQPYVRLNLPFELADRFEVLREIGSGGESDVLLVRRRNESIARPSALKIYRHGLQPDQLALERIKGLPAEHVVPIFASGPSAAGWWEEQEYIEQGSLADLLVEEGPRLGEKRLMEVVRELSSALAAIHPVLHRDVKPTNVLVRTREPLDLVLSDFGLARSGAQTHIMSTIAGSLAYQSPEAVEGGASPARDWWAVGMIVAEAAIGRHPFQDPTLAWPSAQEMKIALTTRPVPLDGVDDTRIRMLCAGLLVRDPHERWGADEVKRWLAGESPAVADELPRGRRQTAIQPFVFAGRRCATPEELAPVLAARWDDALRLISGARSRAPEYVELSGWLEEHDNQPALRVLELAARERGDFARRLFQLLRTLTPELPPSFRGQVIDQAGLLQLANTAAAGDGEAQATLDEIQRLSILAELAREDVYAGLATVADQWTKQVELLGKLRTELGSVGDALDDLETSQASQARILAVLLSQQSRRQLLASADKAGKHAAVRDSGNRLPTGRSYGELYTAVRSTTNEPARLIATLLIPDYAVQQQALSQAQRREEARARSEREAAEQTRLAAERRARRGPFHRLFGSLVRTAIVMAAVAGVYQIIGQIWGVTSLFGYPHNPERRTIVQFFISISVLAIAPSLAAAGAFDVVSWIGGQQRRALPLRGWERLVLIAAGIGPPAAAFATHAHKQFQAWGGTPNGPPLWFWIIGPAAMAAVFVGLLLIRLIRRPLGASAVLAVAGGALALVILYADRGSPYLEISFVYHLLKAA